MSGDNVVWLTNDVRRKKEVGDGITFRNGRDGNDNVVYFFNKQMKFRQPDGIFKPFGEATYDDLQYVMENVKNLTFMYRSGLVIYVPFGPHPKQPVP